MFYVSACKVTIKREKSKRKACFSFLFRAKVSSAKPKLHLFLDNPLLLSAEKVKRKADSAVNALSAMPCLYLGQKC